MKSETENRIIACLVVGALILSVIHTMSHNSDVTWVFKHRAALSAENGKPITIVSGVKRGDIKTGWNNPPLNFSQILNEAEKEFGGWKYLEKAADHPFDQPIQKVEIRVWIE